MAKKHKYLGEVNLLGLGDFGASLSPMSATLIGGGVAGLTSIAVGRTAKAPNREMYGLLAGLAAAGGMYAMRSTRHLALNAAVGAILASGIAWAEKVISGRKMMGMPSVNYLNGLGIPQVSYLNGLGIPSISEQPQAVGTIPGVAGPSFAGARLGEGEPLSLLGPSTAQSEKIALMGGPAVHGLSAAYGATLLGGGRN